jgi:mycofactocin precursor
VAPCANMRVMTTTAAEADIEIPVEDIDEVLAEVLVEEISIDGMCGVY